MILKRIIFKILFVIGPLKKLFNLLWALSN